MRLLVATQSEVHIAENGSSELRATTGLDGHRPTCLAALPVTASSTPATEAAVAWCGTDRGGVFRSDDGGASWRAVGLEDVRITAIAADTTRPDTVWVGTEPSAVWRSDDGGRSWQPTRDLTELPSSPGWAFPPKPETHHVRWIAPQPHVSGRLWVAVEAGALVSTDDDGQSWRDRVPGGPYDTHELAIHPDRPETLRVSAGDGYFESHDGGRSWAEPEDGLDVRYLRSVAIDPGDSDTVVVSAASRPRTAYVAGRSDGRVYRRAGEGRWERVTEGWPEPPSTIAPLLRPGTSPGELWAADERGVHRSDDGGASWREAARYPATPTNLRGFVVLG